MTNTEVCPYVVSPCCFELCHLMWQHLSQSGTVSTTTRSLCQSLSTTFRFTPHQPTWLLAMAPTNQVLVYQIWPPRMCEKVGEVDTVGNEARRFAKLVVGGAQCGGLGVICLKCIYNFLCSMLVYSPFALCFVTLCGVFMHFPELTY
jgi:hypothetical protein